MLTDNGTTNAHVGYACSMFLPLASRMHLFCGSDGQKVEALLLSAEPALKTCVAAAPLPLLPRQSEPYMHHLKPTTQGRETEQLSRVGSRLHERNNSK